MTFKVKFTDDQNDTLETVGENSELSQMKKYTKEKFDKDETYHDQVKESSLLLVSLKKGEIQYNELNEEQIAHLQLYIKLFSHTNEQSLTITGELDDLKTQIKEANLQETTEEEKEKIAFIYEMRKVYVDYLSALAGEVGRGVFGTAFLGNKKFEAATTAALKKSQSQFHKIQTRKDKKITDEDVELLFPDQTTFDGFPNKEILDHHINKGTLTIGQKESYDLVLVGELLEHRSLIHKIRTTIKDQSSFGEAEKVSFMDILKQADGTDIKPGMIASSYESSGARKDTIVDKITGKFTVQTAANEYTGEVETGTVDIGDLVQKISGESIVKVIDFAKQKDKRAIIKEITLQFTSAPIPYSIKEDIANTIAETLIEQNEDHEENFKKITKLNEQSFRDEYNTLNALYTRGNKTESHGDLLNSEQMSRYLFLKECVRDSGKMKNKTEEAAKNSTELQATLVAQNAIVTAIIKAAPNSAKQFKEGTFNALYSDIVGGGDVFNFSDESLKLVNSLACDIVIMGATMGITSGAMIVAKYGLQRLAPTVNRILSKTKITANITSRTVAGAASKTGQVIVGGIDATVFGGIQTQLTKLVKEKEWFDFGDPNDWMDALSMALAKVGVGYAHKTLGKGKGASHTISRVALEESIATFGDALMRISANDIFKFNTTKRYTFQEFIMAIVMTGLMEGVQVMSSKFYITKDAANNVVVCDENLLNSAKEKSGLSEEDVLTIIGPKITKGYNHNQALSDFTMPDNNSIATTTLGLSGKDKGKVSLEKAQDVDIISFSDKYGYTYSEVINFIDGENPGINIAGSVNLIEILLDQGVKLPFNGTHTLHDVSSIFIFNNEGEIKNTEMISFWNNNHKYLTQFKQVHGLKNPLTLITEILSINPKYNYKTIKGSPEEIVAILYNDLDDVISALISEGNLEKVAKLDGRSRASLLKDIFISKKAEIGKLPFFNGLQKNDILQIFFSYIYASNKVGNFSDFSSLFTQGGSNFLNSIKEIPSNLKTFHEQFEYLYNEYKPSLHINHSNVEKNIGGKSLVLYLRNGYMLNSKGIRGQWQGGDFLQDSFFIKDIDAQIRQGNIPPFDKLIVVSRSNGFVPKFTKSSTKHTEYHDVEGAEFKAIENNPENHFVYLNAGSIAKEQMQHGAIIGGVIRDSHPNTDLQGNIILDDIYWPGDEQSGPDFQGKGKDMTLQETRQYFINGVAQLGNLVISKNKKTDWTEILPETPKDKVYTKILKSFPNLDSDNLDERNTAIKEIFMKYRGYQPTEKQIEEINSAHELDGTVGELDAGQIRARSTELKSSTKEERRFILDTGMAGKVSVVNYFTTAAGKVLKKIQGAKREATIKNNPGSLIPDTFEYKNNFDNVYLGYIVKNYDTLPVEYHEGFTNALNQFIAIKNNPGNNKLYDYKTDLAFYDNIIKASPVNGFDLYNTLISELQQRLEHKYAYNRVSRDGHNDHPLPFIETIDQIESGMILINTIYAERYLKPESMPDIIKKIQLKIDSLPESGTKEKYHAEFKSELEKYNSYISDSKYGSGGDANFIDVLQEEILTYGHNRNTGENYWIEYFRNNNHEGNE